MNQTMHAIPSVRNPARGNDAVRLVQERFAQLESQFDAIKEAVRRHQQLSALGTAAAMIAHEFNNLMTPITGYARFALDSDDTELMKKALRMTLRQSDVLTGMAERVLRLSVHNEPTMQPTAIAPLVDDAVAALCRDPAKDGIRLIKNVPADLYATADENQLYQVLFNLTLNATQVVKPNIGRIEVSACKTSDGQVEILCADNGPGIDPAVLDTIFEPFVTSRPIEPGKGVGTGLGLALCRDIIEQHKGSICVKSEPGQGAQFIIRLPAAM